MAELNPLDERGIGWKQDWVPKYTDEAASIEVSEDYQIYKRFGVVVGAINPNTGNDYLVDWKNDQGNRSSYNNIKKRVASLQNAIDTWHLRTIRTYSRMTLDLKRKYAELSERLEDVMQARVAAESEIENIQNFLNPEGLIRELSPYDDTSQIDDTMEVSVGRERPVKLTTKVAQQWYKKFSGALVRGCVDVNNYGPFIGGTPFYRPSLRKRFVFDGNNYGQPLRGIPMTVIDTETLIDSTPGDLSVATDDWEHFGIPLPMDDWGKEIEGKIVNQYGYIPGKASYDENGVNVGGSHVANYGEFLELFGLGPENKMVGSWPKPSDTPLFTLAALGPRGTGRGFGFGTVVGAVAGVATASLADGVSIGLAAQYVRRQFTGNEKRKIENKSWYRLFKEHEDSRAALPYFTMIDEYGNLACPNIFGFGNEAYVQSGWSLRSAGQLVYLYPDWDNAIAYDPIKADRGLDPWMPHAHGYKTHNYSMQFKGGRGGNRNGPHGNSGRAGQGGGDDQWRVGNAHDGMDKKGEAEAALDKVKDSKLSVIGQGQASGHNRGGDYTYLVPGPRLEEGDHNPRLTIHEKRALVIDRSSTRHRFASLGRDRPTENGSYTGNRPYGNPKWPYGTGFYEKNREWKRSGGPVYGSRAPPITGERDMKVAMTEAAVARMIPVVGQIHAIAEVGAAVGVLPDDVWGSNYGMYIGDLLRRLPHGGQFTIINDDDNSPTTVDYDGNIRNGKELNVGFVNFVAQELIHLGVKNRRIGSRWDDGKLKTYTIASHSWKDRLYAIFGDNPAHGFRVKDTTYGDLFGSDGRGGGDDNSGTGAELDFADFSQKIIKSVAEIPIRREVVDNLLNKTNENMSLMQFMQGIMHPSAIGVSTGNIYTSIRPSGGDGGFEVTQVSKNWMSVGKKVREEVNQADMFQRFPDDVMMFDYKASDSLIKSIDMSSKFDPGIAGTFERSAASLASGTKTDLLKFLSYGNMALELRDFLAAAGPENQPDLYKDVIRVDEGDAGSVHVNWSMMGFDANKKGGAEKIAVPESVFTKFLMSDPDRMTKLMSVLQTGKGQTWATDLLANYMRGCTITMHGTCNIKPFNYIYVRGVLPNMKGLYMVHNVRDSVTPQDFDTIIEAVLIDPDPSDENKDAEKAG